MANVKKYNPKPQAALIVEAKQWDGTEENAKEILEWFEEFHSPDESIRYFSHVNFFYISIRSGSFSMTAVKGDYIVRSAKTRSSSKKFSVYSKQAFEAGYYEVNTKPTPTSDQAIEALRLKLSGG